jgi:hypothetical protein
MEKETPTPEQLTCPIVECGGKMYEFYHRTATGAIRAYGLRCDVCELTIEHRVPSHAQSLCRRPSPPPSPEGPVAEMDAEANITALAAWSRLRAVIVPRPAPEVGELRVKVAAEIRDIVRTHRVAPTAAEWYDCGPMIKRQWMEVADRILALLPPKPADEKGGVP